MTMEIVGNDAQFNEKVTLLKDLEIYGNIKTENILDVWKSKRFRELQTQLLAGNRRYSKTCSMCNRGLDKADKKRLKWLTGK